MSFGQPILAKNPPAINFPGKRNKNAMRRIHSASAKLQRHPKSSQRGSSLTTVIIFSVIVAAAVASMGTISLNSMRDSHEAISKKAAYFHAENALLEGAARVAEADVPADGVSWDCLGEFSLAANNLYQAYEPDARLAAATLSIELHPSGIPKQFLVRATATYGGETRGLEARIQRDPPSHVFDYEYFLNNWGWWWGNSITGNGDDRTNGDFDFRFEPEVNGHVYAAYDIEANQVPIDVTAADVPLGGLAGANPQEYIHSGAARLDMPNLSDFSYYHNKAMTGLDVGTGQNTLKIGGVTKIAGAHSNSTDGRGIFLQGTAANPIVIDGTVVVHGDVIIKGPVRGQGTLYVGGNLYIADNVTYADGPSFATPPATMTDEARDAWVEANQDSSLVAFAVRENVLVGDPHSSQWVSYTWGAASYGLAIKGNEALLGADGIPDTADDGEAYLDTNNDGSPDSAWYDVDGDGAVDDNYNYNNDIQVNTARLNKIDNLPAGLTPAGGPTAFSAQASKNITRLDGIFYCNHAFGLRTQAGPSIYNGSVICRDEAIVFTTRLTMNYDPRVHHRYMDDPNKVVDLGLPSTQRVALLTRRELHAGEMAE
jgi:hypothetical protein